MISTYLNGPRTLSDERLSYLYISSPDHVDWTSEKEQDFICMMCATHCIGDGMALYSALNDFFILLGGDGDESELRRLLDAEMDDIRRGSEMQLPREVEKCLPETPSARIYGAIATVDYLVNQRKQIVRSFPPLPRSSLTSCVREAKPFPNAQESPGTPWYPQSPSMLRRPK